jgi:cytochrome c2
MIQRVVQRSWAWCGALLVMASSPASVHAAVLGADSERGQGLFVSLACIQCHSVNGHGGTVGPDLGRIVDRGFTPASLAATMWNHAPSMWPQIQARGLAIGNLDEQAAADLFAYFYSARFFDKPGDAARGKRVFETKHCEVCHGLTAPKLPEAKPVSAWESIGHPMALVNAMWNHVSLMNTEFKKQHVPWAALTSQDVSDLLVYVRNVPPGRQVTPGLKVASGPRGEELFHSKGCANCHQGKLALPQRLAGRTLTDIAVDMWNHGPRMAGNAPRLTLDEMRDVVSYLWADAFFTPTGSVSAGERVFKAKRCAECHTKGAGGAPPLSSVKGSLTAAGMVSALWRHGPKMLDTMGAQGISWPTFRTPEMANLIAYLNKTGGAK